VREFKGKTLVVQSEVGIRAVGRSKSVLMGGSITETRARGKSSLARRGSASPQSRYIDAAPRVKTFMREADLRWWETLKTNIDVIDGMVADMEK
jgi:hypothetical protein